MKTTKIIIASAMLLIVQSANIFAQPPKKASTGCVSGNCINGFGKKIYNSGNIYEGDFVNGSREGKGTLTAKYGTVYTGQFAEDVPNGKGKAKYENGDAYDGDWVDGNMEGQGTLTFKDGNYYIGAFKNDKQNGYGKEYNKAGDIVKEGTWKDDVFIISASGDTPTPTPSKVCVSGNCVNGKGKMVFDYGATYEGDFVNAKMEGQGTWATKTGEVYTGTFANDDFNGKGRLKYGDKGSYEGDFVAGLREGKGTLTLANGDYFTGEFKNNVQNGYGKMYTKATGTFKEGMWKDGVFVE